MNSIFSRLRDLVEWIVIFGVALIVFGAIRMFVVAPYIVPTGSMEPAIEVGDSVFAQKLTLLMGDEVSAGDIVVFSNPDAESEHGVLVKRVIARAGQTVDLRQGAVYVDGIALEEPYAEGASWPLESSAPGAPISYPFAVPDGHVWVMGDNRENSADSRYFGAVPAENLIGVVFFRYWPLDRIGLV